MILTLVSVYVHFTEYCSWPFVSGAFVAVSESLQFQSCCACSVEGFRGCQQCWCLHCCHRRQPREVRGKPQTSLVKPKGRWEKLLFWQVSCFQWSWSSLTALAAAKGLLWIHKYFPFCFPEKLGMWFYATQGEMDVSLGRCLRFWLLSTCWLFMYAYYTIS